MPQPDLSHPDALELLRHQPLAHLGTDGFPRVIPIGFWWNGKNIIVSTAPTSPKVKALTELPQVALTIDSDEGPATRTLFVRGVTSIEIVDAIPDEYLASSTKTMDDEQARQFETQVRAFYQQMARITIEPRWARFYDFATGRIPEFLKRLAER